ncbi:MAG TPA: hypothetical protein VFS16_17965, partial [Acidimicrobiia bacterium]|nr:hypothetical protein [Acidimicrobiia bacterium]
LSFASLFLLAVPVTAGSESLIAVIVVAFAFTMTPALLEEMSLRLSPNIVGGVGLLAGTYIGARGIGGAILDRLRDRRERAALAAAGLLGTTVELRDGREPTVIDTTPAGRPPRRTRPARVPAGAAATNGGELVSAPAGGLASALSSGGGLTLPPRPVSPMDGRR